MTATIAFLGTGSMNGSIAAGLLAAGPDPARGRDQRRVRNLSCSLIDSLWNLCALPPLLLVPALGNRVEPP